MSAEASLSVAEVVRLAEQLRSGGAALRALPTARVAAGLSLAVRSLARVEGPEAAELRVALQRETGLSAAMVEWGLDQLALSFEADAVERLARSAMPPGALQAVPPQLSAVVLSGNVFTAGVRALALPLLVKSPVLVKTTRAGGALYGALIAALREVDEALAQHLGLVAFERTQVALAQAAFARAEVVSAYGDDQTMVALRGLLPPGTRLLEHGHGVSAAYVPSAALTGAEAVQEVALRLALDVAAYDQLGCLSPQVALVQAGGSTTAEGFAQALSQALSELGVVMPRGEVPDEAAAQAMQWRGVASVRGILLDDPEHCCAAESGPVRLGPGYRHVGVYGCRDEVELWQQLAPLGGHLKSVGVAGSHALRDGLLRHIAPGLAPRFCAIGTMQTPPLDAYFDGLPPLHGLLNYIQAG